MFHVEPTGVKIKKIGEDGANRIIQQLPDNRKNRSLKEYPCSTWNKLPSEAKNEIKSRIYQGIGLLFGASMLFPLFSCLCSHRDEVRHEKSPDVIRF